MKKSIIIISILILAVFGLVFLTGCTNKSATEPTNESSKGIDLTLDFSHMNDTTYSMHINTNDTVTEFDEEEPNFVRLENTENNYVLDLTLDTESKDAYEQFKTSAKEENELFEETKFGKYDGYYSDDDGIYGYILLDSSDPTFNVYCDFYVYLLDDTLENSDINDIYKSEQIQNVLNNIEFKSSK